MKALDRKAADNFSPLVFARIDTPLGPMVAVADGSALRLLEFEGEGRGAARVSALEKRFGRAVIGGKNDVIEAAGKELGEYFAGKRKGFDVPLAMEGTDFEERVWGALSGIPYGRTKTYGELAAEIERKGSARAVGGAIGRNPVLVILPCHRVTGADGLGGYAGGIERKKALLALEAGASKLS
jgi:AraC family transcriptional regulator, regulatory protein of adaptative response / methylated-DNA-[protein]-cysteine methyltransferase